MMGVTFIFFSLSRMEAFYIINGLLSHHKKTRRIKTPEGLIFSALLGAVIENISQRVIGTVPEANILIG